MNLQDYSEKHLEALKVNAWESVKFWERLHSDIQAEENRRMGEVA